MPIETGIWRIQESADPVPLAGIDYEQHLQQIIASDLTIVDSRLMLIGREVPTAFGGRIDILAIDADGNLTVIELKRDQTPREVVAQLLDYASWVRHLSSEAIAEIFIDYQIRFLDIKTPEGIDVALHRQFKSVPDELNIAHRLLIVAGELDSSTERIVSYLQDQYYADINVAFFRTFEDEGRLYLTRTWLAEPDSLAADNSSSATAREWNGEFYLAFREDESRQWDDARKYRFVSAGGGETYVGPLRNLQPGDRVWVHVPGKGYLGVGKVKAPAVRPDKFMVESDGTCKALTEFELKATNAFSEGQGEHFVGVRWIKSFDIQHGAWERGFFNYRGIVARPSSPKWHFTIERLRSLWGVG